MSRAGAKVGRGRFWGWNAPNRSPLSDLLTEARNTGQFKGLHDKGARDRWLAAQPASIQRDIQQGDAVGLNVSTQLAHDRALREVLPYGGAGRPPDPDVDGVMNEAVARALACIPPESRCRHVRARTTTAGVYGLQSAASLSLGVWACGACLSLQKDPASGVVEPCICDLCGQTAPSGWFREFVFSFGAVTVAGNHCSTCASFMEEHVYPFLS